LARDVSKGAFGSLSLDPRSAVRNGGTVSRVLIRTLNLDPPMVFLGSSRWVSPAGEARLAGRARSARPAKGAFRT